MNAECTNAISMTYKNDICLVVVIVQSYKYLSVPYPLAPEQTNSTWTPQLV